MNFEKEEQKREEFRAILLELAKKQDFFQNKNDCSEMYRRLEKLYDAGCADKHFRHFYSDIFSVLTQLQQNPDLGDINILGQNLDVIRSNYSPPDDDGTRDISDEIRKLYDHVSLDIARISYSDGADRRISGEKNLKNLQAQIHSVQDEAHGILESTEATEKKLIKVEEKLDNSQKEYITILGIFAAIVLAFTGGIAFSTSVLNNIAKVSAYRSIIISLFIGIVLINILFGLFYYINSMVNKEQKIQPLIVSNIIMLILLAVTIAAWSRGWVESRDQRIQTVLDSQTERIGMPSGTTSNNFDTTK